MSSSLIYTFTGRLVNPLQLTVDDICIEDIARALSMICRYNGHVRRFYSVAEHSVLVAREFCYSYGDSSSTEMLGALLHDAAEAYLCDLITPLKDRLPSYKEAEDRALKCIFTAFNLPPGLHPDVFSIDKRILIDEMLELHVRNPAVNGSLRGLPMTGQCIQCLTPLEAEREFLQEFTEISLLRGFSND